MYVPLHLFTNGSVYSLWGNGSWYMIAISALQLICTLYSYLLSSTQDMDRLRQLLDLRSYYMAIVGIVSFPVGLVTFIAIYAFQESDQIASYTVSSNMLQYSFATLFPFLCLVIFTYWLGQMRQYELDDTDIDFKPDYHFGPKTVQSAKPSSSTKKRNDRELTMKLL